jgi:hypothetical protein
MKQLHLTHYIIKHQYEINVSLRIQVMYTDGHNLTEPVISQRESMWFAFPVADPLSDISNPI